MINFINNTLVNVGTVIGSDNLKKMQNGGETIKTSSGDTITNPLHEIIAIGDSVFFVAIVFVILFIAIGLVVAWASSASSPNNAEAKEDFQNKALMSVVQLGLLILIATGIFTTIFYAIITGGGA